MANFQSHCTATHSQFSLRHGNDSLQITGGRPDDWRVKLAETRTAIKTSLQSPVTLGSKILAVRLSDLASVWKKQVLGKAMSITGHADHILSQHFAQMSSGWRYHVPPRKTNGYPNSFTQLLEWWAANRSECGAKATDNSFFLFL